MTIFLVSEMKPTPSLCVCQFYNFQITFKKAEGLTSLLLEKLAIQFL